MTSRRTAWISPLILAAVGLSAGATGLLVAYPRNPHVWQAGAWTLAAALAALLVLVPVSGYVLATRRIARTRWQIAAFATGLACLAMVAIGSI